MRDTIQSVLTPDQLRRASIKDYHHGEFGHFPDRIFKETENVQNLRKIADEFTSDNPPNMGTLSLPDARQQLENTILYYCYGRIFTIPNSTADFIPVIDPKSIDISEHPELKTINFNNYIALIKVGGKLAVVGGFNDIGESLAKTAGRESHEELHVEDIQHAIMIGKASKSIRDPRFPVDTTITSGEVNYEQLKSGDDAEKDSVIIVKLFNEDGSFNTSYFESEKEHTDIRGNTFRHRGWRADHKFLVERLYRYWEKYGKNENLTLSQTLEKMSAIYPQDWFKGYEKHAKGADDYTPHFFEGVGEAVDKTGIATATQSVLKMLKFWKIKDAELVATNYVTNRGLENLPDHLAILPETKNIGFALETITSIFQEAGYENALSRAEKFIFDLYAKDILPVFPQTSVAVDCLVIDGNELIVEKINGENGDISYALPGSFFSPDPKNPDKPMDKVISMKEFAEETVWDRIGMDIRVDGYLVTAGGTDATGELVDKRYPRITNVVMARASNTYNPAAIRKGHEIARLKLRKEDGQLNEELYKLKWKYGHDKEILPQFMRFLNLFDPDNRKRAEDIVRENAFGNSFGP